MNFVANVYGLKTWVTGMTIRELLILEEYTNGMRFHSLSNMFEVKWTDQELEDPKKQRLILSGVRRWKCKHCSKEVLDHRVPYGCLHYYKRSVHVTHTLFSDTVS